MSAIMLSASPAFARGRAADLAVSGGGSSPVGKGVISATGAGETLFMHAPSRWGGASFTVTCRNLSDHPASLRIVGRRSSQGRTFYYFEGRTTKRAADVTAEVAGRGLVTPRLAPGAAIHISVRVKLVTGEFASGFVHARPVGGGLMDAVRIQIGHKA